MTNKRVIWVLIGLMLAGLASMAIAQDSTGTGEAVSVAADFTFLISIAGLAVKGAVWALEKQSWIPNELLAPLAGAVTGLLIWAASVIMGVSFQTAQGWITTGFTAGSLLSTARKPNVAK